MKFKQYFFSYICLFLWLSPYSWAQQSFLPFDKEISQYTFRSWNNKDGLPAIGANSILRYRNEYIWVATYNGLFVFDGMQLKKATIEGENIVLRGNAYVQLYEDSLQRLWVTSESNGLLVKNRNKWVQYRKEDGLPSNSVRCVYQVDKSTFLAGTMEGLAVFDGEQFTQAGLPKELTRHTITAITTDKQHRIWVAVQGEGLYRLSLPDLQIEQHYLLPNGASALALLCDRVGNIWVGTDNGIRLISPSGELLSLGVGNELPGSYIRALYEAPSGAIWIGTTSGLALYESNKLSKLEPSPKIGQHDVTFISGDRENNIWVSTYRSGFYQLSGGKFLTFSAQNGLAGNAVFEIMEWENGKLLVATNQGVSTYERGYFSPFIVNGIPLTSEIRAMTIDQQGLLWLGGRGGLWRQLPNGSFAYFDHTSGLPNSFVRDILAAKDGSVWVATNYGLARYKDGQWITYFKEDGLSNSSIISLFEDSEGQIWIGTMEGVNTFHQEVLKSRNAEPNAPDHVVFEIFEDLERNLWIGTQSGLFLYEKGLFRKFKQETLPFFSVFQVIEDFESKLWITTNDGVYRIPKVALLQNIKSTPRLFDMSDGLKTSACTANGKSLLRKDGSIWIATMEGIAVAVPKIINQRVSQHEPVVYIEKVLADGQELPIQVKEVEVMNAQGQMELRKEAEVNVDSEVKRLEIQYTAFHFSAPEKVKFLRSLIGSDHIAPEVVSERTFAYNSLPGGEYTFNLSASNEDGQWSKNLYILKIKKEKKISETYLPEISGLVLVILLVIISHQYRDRKRSELKRKVEEQTQELNQQKQDLEQQNQRLETAYQELNQNKMHLEKVNQELLVLDEEKNNLISIVAHDLKAPLNQITGLIQLMRMSGERFSDETNEYFDYMQTSVKRLNDMIIQILNINAIESKKINLNIGLVNLEKVIDECAQSFEKSANRKEIQIVFDHSAGQNMIMADEQICFMVFQNLLSNALKFSPRNTTVRISVFENSEGIVGAVSDEGPGITPEDATKLFHKYSKLSARPTAGEDSTGLGLSIVKKYVEEMSGKVWCESAPGMGATFYVMFPKADVTMEATTTESVEHNQ